MRRASLGKVSRQRQHRRAPAPGQGAQSRPWIAAPLAPPAALPLRSAPPCPASPMASRPVCPALTSMKPCAAACSAGPSAQRCAARCSPRPRCAVTTANRPCAGSVTSKKRPGRTPEADADGPVTGAVLGQTKRPRRALCVDHRTPAPHAPRGDDQALDRASAPLGPVAPAGGSSLPSSSHSGGAPAASPVSCVIFSRSPSVVRPRPFGAQPGGPNR